MAEFGKFKIFYDASSAGGGPYTQHQIDLIKGDAEPATNEEWNYVQDHCTDLLPQESPPSSHSDVSPRQEFIPPTFVAEVARALEEKENKADEDD